MTGLLAYIPAAANPRSSATALRWPGSSAASSPMSGGRSAGSTCGAARARWPSSPSSLRASSRSGAGPGGRRCRIVRTLRHDRVHRSHDRRCPIRRIRRASWQGCARHQARHCRCRSISHRLAVSSGGARSAMVGVAVIPADERRRSDDAGQILAGDPHRAIRRSAPVAIDNGVVQPAAVPRPRRPCRR